MTATRVGLLLMIAIIFVLLAFSKDAAPGRTNPDQYSFRVLHVYRHDPSAFTQGLEFRAGYLYEGTGLQTRSTLRKEKLETGEVLQEIRIAPEYFGEGITLIGGRILELTWQAQIGFIYDQASFRRVRTFSYPGEGWGLANDGAFIYMSDGSAYIRCLNRLT